MLTNIIASDNGVQVSELLTDASPARDLPEGQNSASRFKWTQKLAARNWGIFRSTGKCTSMTVHEGTRHMAVTYLSGNPSAGMGIMKMPSNESTDIYDDVSPGLIFGPGFSRGGGEVDIFSSAPAPPSSSTLFAFGSSHGILQLDKRDFGMSWLGSTLPNHSNDPYPRDVFTLQFLSNHPSVLLSGGRNGIVEITDCRSPEWGSETSRLRHPSAVTHIRQLDDHRIIVAGLHSTLRQYDLRYRKRVRQTVGTQKKKCTIPILEYPEYRNSATIQIGFDVDIETGVVAAGQDFGQLALFSLHGGEKLTSLALEKPYTGAISCIRFAEDNDRGTRSLWAGNDAYIERFAW